MAAASPRQGIIGDFGVITFPDGKKYNLIRYLGHGAHGNVYEVQEMGSLRSFAFKISEYSLKEEAENHKVAAQCLHTMKILAYASGANFADHLSNTIKTVDVIVMPLLGRNMRQDFDGKHVPLLKIQSIVAQLLFVLKSFRTRQIIHGDLKPENLIWNQFMDQLTVFDFFFSRPKEKWSSHLQSPGYKSPEVILLKQFDYAVDMWTVGLMMIEWYLGKRVLPIGVDKEKRNENCSDTLRIMVDQFGPLPKRWLEEHDYPFPPGELYKHYSEDNWQKEIWREAARRSDKGEDVRLFIDLLKKMMVYEGRITAENALKHPFINAILEEKESQEEMPAHFVEEEEHEKKCIIL